MNGSTALDRYEATAIRSPRVCDAVGVALRDSYAQAGDVPEDIAMLLRKLGNTHGLRIVL